ncbi:MAG: hypothetical protein M3Y08_02480 [Fibrobacterota bacterium]|nr:hypothetical protein [Fibrobacterota bacterium]
MADFRLLSSTYLGGPAADSAQAVDIGPDGIIWLSGLIRDENFGLTPSGNAQATGAVLRLSADGRKAESLLRWGNSVDDLEVAAISGQAAAISEAGLALIAADGKQVLWQKPLTPAGGGSSKGPGRRVSIGKSGIVAALHGKTITTFDAAGTQLGEWALGNAFVEDLAVDEASKLVIVTGFDNKKLSSANTGCASCPVQVAYMYAYDYAGTKKWTNWAWSGTEMDNGNEADTRGYRLSLGRDGKLCFGGESAGGNSMFRYDPRKLGVTTIVSGDKYTQAYNTASNHISYFGRFNPADGAPLGGQLILARLPNTKGNTLRMQAVTCDEQGDIYVGGVTAWGIDSTTRLSVGDKKSALAGGYLLKVSADFKKRLLWTTFDAATYASNVRGVAAAGGKIAVALVAESDSLLVIDAIQTKGNGVTKVLTDAGLAVVASDASGIKERTSQRNLGNTVAWEFTVLGPRRNAQAVLFNRDGQPLQLDGRLIPRAERPSSLSKP